tara:strand:+ start:6690 stop:7130 length:441 start_codon:yes stop_codon:yes gene_type:complete
MASYNGIKVGKALFYLMKENAVINAANLLNYDSSLIQPAPMRLESDPALGITYEIDAIENIKVKAPFYTTPPVNISTVRLEAFAKDYGNGVLLASALIEQVATSFVPFTYNGVKLERISIDSVKQDFNPKTRRYIWTVFLDVTTYN